MNHLINWFLLILFLLAIRLLVHLYSSIIEMGLLPILLELILSTLTSSLIIALLLEIIRL